MKPTHTGQKPTQSPIKAPPCQPHLLVNLPQWHKRKLAHYEKPGRLQPDMTTATGEAVRLAHLYPMSRIAIFQCVGYIEFDAPEVFSFSQALAAITGLWSEPHALSLFKRWLCAPERRPDKPVTAANLEEVLAKWRKGSLPRDIVLTARESFRAWYESLSPQPANV